MPRSSVSMLLPHPSAEGSLLERVETGAVACRQSIGLHLDGLMGAGEPVREHLESEASSELRGETVSAAAELLMDAEVDVRCGDGERSDAPVNSRNSHGRRRWDTRAGTVTLEVPKLRRGS